ncbi:MAG: GNAT family N-acetyltransferase [Bryobacter sp.]|nr:GNAT family N-acetyltransferase [Bryobacter sp.]
MIAIRRARPEDALTIASFNRAMALETENLALDPEKSDRGAEAVFADPGLGFYLVAESGGAVAGCLMITYEWSDWRNGMFWWVQSVYVKPEWRGRGVYKSLYAEAKRLAAAQGNVCGFRLYVERENERAQATYRRQGMHETHYRLYEETV